MSVSHRFVPLDIFRGLTIFLMILVNTPGSFEDVYPLLAHAPWFGCTLADLVFPFFLFSVGFSGFLSCQKHGGALSAALLRKILFRTAMLFILGIIFNTFPFYDVEQGLSLQSAAALWENVRVFGILQRIACAYCLGTLLCLLLKTGPRILTAGVFLLFIHCLGLYLYAPEAPFAAGHNLSQAIDVFFPGIAHVYQEFGHPFDPEGIYGTLSAAVSVMLGYLIGREYHAYQLFYVPQLRFIAYGLAGVFLGVFLSLWIPIGKALWTASYVMLTSGIAVLILVLLDVVWSGKSVLSGCLQPLQALGSNAIFFFFVPAFAAQSMAFPWGIVDEVPLYEWLYQNLFLSFLESAPRAASFLFSMVYAVLCCLLAEILYRRKIFFKI